MTPADVFRARLDKLTAAVRAADDLDRVIVWPMEPKHPDEPERTIGGTRWVRPEWWPAGLPLPLTVGDALDVVEAAADALASKQGAQMEGHVADLVPDPAMRAALDLAELARAWPWGTGDRAAPSIALGSVLKLARGAPEIDRATWVGARLSWGAARWSDEVYRARDLPRSLDWHLDAGIELLYHAVRVAWPDALAPGLDVLDALAELLRAPGAGDVFHLAIDRATRAADGTRDPLAEVDEGTAGRWAGELFALARGVAKAIEAVPPVDAPIQTEGEARATAQLAALALADAMDRLGPAGRERAAEVRTKAAERAADVNAGTLPPGALWRPWFRSPSGPPRWIDMLARVLWADRWRPERARQAEDTFARLLPSVATAVVSMTKAAGTGDPYRDRIPLLDDKGRGLVDVLVDAHTTSLPAMTPDRLRRVFGSMTCHRWIRYALPELQALWRANNTATSLTISGGKSGIIQAMRAVGLGGSRADEDVIADVIPLVGAVVAPVGYGRKGNLYSYTIPSSPEDWRTRTGRPAQLITITPNEPLDPCILFDTRTKQAVPVDRELPPLGWVDRGQHAAVATLAILIAQNQIERRGEIAEHGGVLMTAEIWTEMINGANLRDPGGFLWTLTRDALTDGGRSDVGAAGGEPVPPFLDIVARERDGAARVILSAERPGIRAWLDRAVKGHEEHAAPKPQTPKRKRRR